MKTKSDNLIGYFLESFVEWASTHPKQVLAFMLFVGLCFVNIYIAVCAYLLFNIFLRIFKTGWVFKSVLFFIFALGFALTLVFFCQIPSITSKEIKLPIFARDKNGNYRRVDALPQNISMQEKSHHAFETLKKENAHIISHAKQGKWHLPTDKSLWFLIVTIAGVMSYGFWLISLIRKNSHSEKLKRIQQGKIVSEYQISKKQSQRRLKKTTAFAVNLNTGAPCHITDKQLNEVLMVVGTTGAGKTVTLTNFYRRAIRDNDPLIIVDGKPDKKNIQALHAYAQKNNRPFYSFNAINYDSYNFLTHGTPTELKDKIMSLKDEWSSDHYRSMSSAYLQIAMQVLQSESVLNAKNLIAILEPDELLSKKRHAKSQEIKDKIDSAVADINPDDLKGLKAHLSELLNSDLGVYLACEKGFSLTQAVHEKAVVYFALPALTYPEYAGILGKLVVNDIKSVVAKQEKKMICCFDEFSVFAGNQVLNLINQGRGPGAHTILGTQGFADLEAESPVFKKQLLNCVNTLIVHRVNDVDTAQECSAWIGTRKEFGVTSQLDAKSMDASMGSVRETREFIVHPDDIKQNLLSGEAYLCSKVDGFSCQKIKVKYPN